MVKKKSNSESPEVEAKKIAGQLREYIKSGNMDSSGVVEMLERSQSLMSNIMGNMDLDDMPAEQRKNIGGLTGVIGEMVKLMKSGDATPQQIAALTSKISGPFQKLVNPNGPAIPMKEISNDASPEEQFEGLLATTTSTLEGLQGSINEKMEELEAQGDVDGELQSMLQKIQGTVSVFSKMSLNTDSPEDLEENINLLTNETKKLLEGFQEIDGGQNDSKETDNDELRSELDSVKEKIDGLEGKFDKLYNIVTGMAQMLRDKK